MGPGGRGGPARPHRTEVPPGAPPSAGDVTMVQRDGQWAAAGADRAGQWRRRTAPRSCPARAALRRPPPAARPPPAPAPPPSVGTDRGARRAAAAGAGGGGSPSVRPSWDLRLRTPRAGTARSCRRGAGARPAATAPHDEGTVTDPRLLGDPVQEPGGWPRSPCREAAVAPASMPWDAQRPGGAEGASAARLRAQKQCRKSSFAFYQAVRDLLPVWLLEDMRASEAFHWDERGLAAAYSPSEALLYALVHDHQAYAHYLLATFPRRALAPPSAGFRCCAAPGPHVALAVRYNRVGILRRILRTVRDFPAEERARLLDRRGCGRVEGGGTSLHVACELARPECLFLLLGHGASPGLRDGGGLTPLELLLRHLGLDSGATPATGAPAVPGEAPAAPGEARQRRLLLLDLLVLYTPAAARLARCELLGDRPRWQRLLGEDKFQWLAGLAPPSLFVRAMQVLVTAISPSRFPEALDELPLPPFLQPLDLTGKG